MLDRTYAVHAPALSLQEAAMLPALPQPPQPALPRNLRLPDRRTYYPMPPLPAEPALRRGSMAGRAVLRAVMPKQKGRA